MFSLFLLFALSASAQTPASLLDIGTTAPTPGTADVSQLSTVGDLTAPDNLNYYTDNQTEHTDGEPGQTFTTGGNGTGYVLTSLALKSAGLNSGGGSPGGTINYLLHFYSVSDGSATTIATYITTAPVSYTEGHWLQWTGLSLPLFPNTTYAWSFGKAESGGGWDAIGVASGNPYSGGEIGLIPPAGGAITFGGSHNFDASFDVGLKLAGPATAPAITNTPATGVLATSANLNGKVTSTGGNVPVVIIYYGPTDGGTTATAWQHATALGPESGGFTVPIPALSSNATYYYTAFASNTAGIAWAAPSQTFTTLASNPAPMLVSVSTYHNDNARTGANTNETALTPGNVNATSFGRLFSYSVDGHIYAQPLVMTNVAIPGQGVRKVVFVATEHDSVYAFDADGNFGTTGGLLWQTNLGVSAVMPNNDFGNRYGAYHDLVPEIGITGTPVIDPASGTLFVDVFTHEGNNVYYHRIHALDITTGHERPYSPVLVAASVPGSGVGSSAGVIQFNPEQQFERAALTLAGGKLFVAYGSYADTDPYHGWLLGFSATNLQFLTNYVFNTTPNATTAAFGANAGEGALWMAGNGLSVDANTNLFFMTANGSFSQNTNGGDYGDSFMRLTTTNGLHVADYFTPSDQASLQASDNDLGSGGPLLLPDSAGNAAHRRLIVGSGKEGTIYLVDRDNMGHFNGSGDSQIVGKLSNIIGGTWSSPAFFNGWVYYQGNGDVMKAFVVTNAVIAGPVSSSSTSFGFPGATPAISANGTNAAIAWIIQADAYGSGGPAILHAYNATNLSQELYNSSQNLSRDDPGGAVKMTVPTIAGGKVYVGAEYKLSVYGNGFFLPTPAVSPKGGVFTNSVTVTLSDATPGASIYYTTDGTVPTTNSLLYTVPFTVTNSVDVQALAVLAGAVDSGAAMVSFINSSEIGSGTGLLGAYYANHSSSSPFTGVPTLSRTDPEIDFNWDSSGPSASVGQTGFTARWIGSVQPQFNETYTFYATADDGVRVWVNGQELINGWADQAPTTYQGSIALQAQQLYDIEMDYYQNGGGAEAILEWSSASTPRAFIPQTQLYPFTNPPPTIVLQSPSNNAAYTGTASVTLGAEADAPYNPISNVSFYANGMYLGSVVTEPYTLTATGLGAGSYALTAVATDGSGLSSTSAPVSISVSGGGQPYGLTSNGIAPAFFNMPPTFTGALPPLLSLTGVFTNTSAMTPAGGLILYQPTVPLWSDDAMKIRYLAVPGTNGAITPKNQISFAPTGPWTFPAGTVFVKTFELLTNRADSNSVLRLETRLLVRDINGQVYGVTYKWRPDNSDADLLTTSSNQIVTITTPTGTQTQTWYYPSPADCLTCHTPIANYVLGVSTRQLNGNLTYPSTGVADNQLRTLNRLGLLNPAFDEAVISNFTQMAALTNVNASFEQRARSYLDANCAQCHQPNGTGPTFDARYEVPLASENIINAAALGSLGYDHVHVVTPKDPWRSAIYDRMNTADSQVKMPKLARNLVDSNAVAVMAGWINSLSGGTQALSPPVITPAAGTYIGSVNVTVQPPDTNATVYVTFDGSLPSTNSLVYTGPFLLARSANFSASAWETGYNNSVAASAQFTVQPLSVTSVDLTGSVLSLSFPANNGATYVLEATTNFSNWIPLATNLATSGQFNLYDSNAAQFPSRFYRVRSQ